MGGVEEVEEAGVRAHTCVSDLPESQASLGSTIKPCLKSKMEGVTGSGAGSGM